MYKSLKYFNFSTINYIISITIWIKRVEDECERLHELILMFSSVTREDLQNISGGILYYMASEILATENIFGEPKTVAFLPRHILTVYFVHIKLINNNR